MEKVHCFSQYDPPPVVLEERPDVGIVDCDGYVRTEDLIERFLEAGERLNYERSFFYKNEDVVDDEDTGSVDLNYVDAMQASSEVKKRLSNFKKRKEAEGEEKIAEEKVKEGEVNNGN